MDDATMHQCMVDGRNQETLQIAGRKPPGFQLVIGFHWLIPPDDVNKYPMVV